MTIIASRILSQALRARCSTSAITIPVDYITNLAKAYEKEQSARPRTRWRRS